MLKLYQVLTNDLVKEINEESSDELNPIFIDIPSLEGDETVFKFELINESNDKKYENINIYIDDSNDTLDSNIVVKLMVKGSAPTKDEFDALSNMNSVEIAEIGPEQFVTLWIYVYYPGANELNLSYSLQHVFVNSLIVESTEVIL